MRATSLDAARSMETNASTLRGHVLREIIRAGAKGCTDEELQTALDMRGNTERPRRVELEMRGLVRDSGKTRLTISGREAIVWVAK